MNKKPPKATVRLITVTLSEEDARFLAQLLQQNQTVAAMVRSGEEAEQSKRLVAMLNSALSKR